jgi:hypothetical protein
MGLSIFTLVHVIISLVGIAAGFGMLSGLLAARLFPRWTAVYLVTTLATSVTGFFFPFKGFTPAIGFGILSSIVLAVALYALYSRRLAGKWRRAFVINSVVALYLNVFVLITQLFQKMPALKELAPTQTEPPFGITHGVVLVAFVLMGMKATSRFRGEVS